MRFGSASVVSKFSWAGASSVAWIGFADRPKVSLAAVYDFNLQFAKVFRFFEAFCANPELARTFEIMGTSILRSALLALSSALGGFGIFFLYHSFVYPPVGSHALVFLGAASTIAWFVDGPARTS